MKNILIASGNKFVIDIIKQCLKSDYNIETVTNRVLCLEKISKKKHYEFVFINVELLSDARIQDGYRKVLQQFWHAAPNTDVIVLSSQEMIRESVNAVKAGASNYLTYPINPDELKYVMDSLVESKRMMSELDYLRDTFWKDDSIEVIRTKSRPMKKIFEKIRSVAQTDTTVLLTGETGTGKGVLARLIHRHSKRSQNQYINVHCGAIQDTLLESELFGHEKGAFTGAIRRKPGKFEIAHKGTIFLDEIGTISPSMQIKLLKVLQEKTFERVGGEESIETDVRIITATNEDLQKLCKKGIFRSDLYYRLNVFPIEVPPLRERVEDIPQLIEVFLNNLNKYYAKDIHDVHPHVLEAFEKYSWPGNIRELENLIERAYTLETSAVLTPESFPSELFLTAPRISINTSLTLKEVRTQAIENIERRYLKKLLMINKGIIKDTAEATGIGVRALHKLLTKYSIRKDDFKKLA